MGMRSLAGSIAIWISLAAAAAQQIPRKAPDWTIGMTGGKSIALRQYKGKVVLMAFILTTCPHCQHTVGFLNKDQDVYGPRGFQVLGSAIDQGAPGLISAFAKDFHVTFPVGYNTDPNALLNFMGFDRNHLPHMPILLFIDRRGTIREQHEGSEEKDYFNNRLEQNLQKSIEALLRE